MTRGENSTSSEPLHMLVVPFQAEGHVNGILRLAQNIAAAREADAVVTFAYPARFYHLALKRHQLLAPPSNLRLRVLEDGLPRDEEQSLTLPLVYASIPIFRGNVQLLLDELLHTSADLPAPVCLISDTFVPWTQDLANAARLPRVDFWACTAAVYSMGTQLSLLVSKSILPLPKNCWVDPETKWSVNAPLIEGVPGLPPFLATDLPKEFVQAEDVTSCKDLQFMLGVFSRVREAHTIIVHSLYELESPVLDALQADGHPIHAVGPLPDAPAPSQGVNAVLKHECLHWLDTQPPASVIYVALCSVAKLTPPTMHGLALGLEASKRPFLWVIRTDSSTDALPPGFLQRTVEQGLGLIVSWSPQAQVLSHPSIGAFFSHCGWNSTLECMWEGVPMVACPRAAEQRSNARWIVDTWKIGVALEREQDGSFTKQAVEKALRKKLSEDGAEYYREKALHAKEMARRAFQEGGSSHAIMIGFLQKFRHAN